MPLEEESRTALDANPCRCGSHDRLVQTQRLKVSTA